MPARFTFRQAQRAGQPFVLGAVSVQITGPEGDEIFAEALEVIESEARSSHASHLLSRPAH